MAKVTVSTEEGTVALNCDETAVPQAEWLLAQIAAQIRRRIPLKDGTELAFGWVPLTLRRSGPEWLVCAPDFKLRGQMTTDLTSSLRVQGEQLAMVRAVQARPAFATYRQVLFVAAEAWMADEVILSRLRQPTEEDSGWTALPKRVGAAALEGVRVHELLDRKPSWIPVLALPPGYIVQFKHDSVVAVGAGMQTDH